MGKVTSRNTDVSLTFRLAKQRTLPLRLTGPIPGFYRAVLAPFSVQQRHTPGNSKPVPLDMAGEQGEGVPFMQYAPPQQVIPALLMVMV